MGKDKAKQIFESLKIIKPHFFDTDKVSGENKLRINTTEDIIDFIYLTVGD